MLYKVLDLIEKVLDNSLYNVRKKMTSIIVNDVKKSYNRVSVSEDFEYGTPEIILEELEDNDIGWEEATDVHLEIARKFKPNYNVLSSVLPNTYPNPYIKKNVK